MSAQKVSIKPIKYEDKNVLSKIYKEVFSGHPWHEDLICANTLQGKCSTQYTFNECERYDTDSSGKTINSCLGNYKNRTNSEGVQEIILLSKKNPLEKCIGCGEELKVIEYYPDYRNHMELIEESLEKKGFSGYLAQDETEKVIGFTWGYLMPQKRTISVNFPKVNPLLIEKGINPEKTFYASEIGVIDSYQNKGVGGLLARARLLKSHMHDSPEKVLTRTINPAVHRYFANIFSGKQGEILFEDPETKATWFAWDFKDFDKEGVWKRISSQLKKE